MPVQGCRWPGPFRPLKVKGRHPTWTGHPSIMGRTHTHPHTKTGIIRHTDSPWCTSLGRGKKLKSPEKTHTEMERTYKLHTDSGPCWELIFFSINVITKQYWTKHCSRTCTMLWRSKEDKQLLFAEWVLKTTNSLLFAIKTRKVI